MVKQYLLKVRKFCELSLQIAISEFKLRNEGSYLGIFWYLLNPILMFFLLLLIFKDRLGANLPFYELYLLIGVIIFNFFQSTTIEATRSFIKEHRVLIKSINFPKEGLVFGIVLKNLFSHFFEILLLAIFLVYFKVHPSNLVFYLPILFFLFLFNLGVSFVLSSLTVYFVDMENIWNFAVKLIWLGTPIFYSIGQQTRLFLVNLANPMYYFITASRTMIIFGKMPDLWLIVGLITYSIFVFLLGLFLFNKLKTKMAEMI